MTKNIPLKTDDKEILKETIDTEEEYMLWLSEEAEFLEDDDDEDW